MTLWKDMINANIYWVEFSNRDFVEMFWIEKRDGREKVMGFSVMKIVHG